MRRAHAQRSLPTICDLPMPAAPLVPSGSPSVVPLTIFGSRPLHPFFPRRKCLHLSCRGLPHSQILTLSPDPSPFSGKPNFRDWACPASFPAHLARPQTTPSVFGRSLRRQLTHLQKAIRPPHRRERSCHGCKHRGTLSFISFFAQATKSPCKL